MSNIEEEEFDEEVDTIDRRLHELETPEVDGVILEEVIEAEEYLEGMAALWDVASAEECYEMVTIILELEISATI